MGAPGRNASLSINLQGHALQLFPSKTAPTRLGPALVARVMGGPFSCPSPQGNGPINVGPCLWSWNATVQFSQPSSEWLLLLGTDKNGRGGDRVKKINK